MVKKNTKKLLLKDLIANYGNTLLDRPIVGLDLSINNPGICIINYSPDPKNQSLAWRNVESFCIPADVTQTVTTRIHNIKQTLDERISLLKPFICIEDYAFNSLGKSNNITMQAELGGVVKNWALTNRFPFITIPIFSSKKFMMGKVEKGKDLVLLTIYKKYGLSFNTSDEADAFCVAVVGGMLAYYTLSGDNVHLLSYEKEVIEKLWVTPQQ